VYTPDVASLTEHDEGDVHVPAEMVKPYFYSHHQGMKSAQGSTLFQRKNARFNQLANAVSHLIVSTMLPCAVVHFSVCVRFTFIYPVSDVLLAQRG
jgi:hypothetical protein